MDSLLSVTAVTSDYHLCDLRCLHDQSESNIQNLGTLGVEPDSYRAMLSSVLFSNLLPELNLIVSCQISTDNLDLEKLLEPRRKYFGARGPRRYIGKVMNCSVCINSKSKQQITFSRKLLSGKALNSLFFCQLTQIYIHMYIHTQADATKCITQRRIHTQGN